MFTGIILAVGTIGSAQHHGGDRRLRVEAGGLDLSEAIHAGDLIAAEQRVLGYAQRDPAIRQEQPQQVIGRAGLQPHVVENGVVANLDPLDEDGVEAVPARARPPSSGQIKSTVGGEFAPGRERHRV